VAKIVMEVLVKMCPLNMLLQFDAYYRFSVCHPSKYVEIELLVKTYFTIMSICRNSMNTLLKFLRVLL
jgi:hypothetical protein